MENWKLSVRFQGYMAWPIMADKSWCLKCALTPDNFRHRVEAKFLTCSCARRWRCRMMSLSFERRWPSNSLRSTFMVSYSRRLMMASSLAAMLMMHMRWIGKLCSPSPAQKTFIHIQMFKEVTAHNSSVPMFWAVPSVSVTWNFIPLWNAISNQADKTVHGPILNLPSNSESY